MSTLQFFNTLGRKKQSFKPIHSDYVGIYTCGPTVYNYAHIGNLRAYVFADILRRTLEYFGYNVRHVMNITDVGHLTDDADSGDDKMEVQARKDGMTAWDIAEKYTKVFFEHTGQMNIKVPTIISKATEHISEQIELIKTLELKGFTYITNDGVYFDSSKFKSYGDLAKLKIDGLRAGERVDIAEKRNKTDFALWKFSSKDKKRSMEWESPWGIGFPGWHLECSAMAMKYLGEKIDIHTGGIDHIPVHHTNEIAQSESATGKGPFSNLWLHVEFLTLDKDERMSKSSGNFVTLDTLKERGVDPLEYRFFLISAHYRSRLKFSMMNLEQAQNSYKRLKRMIIDLKKKLKHEDIKLGSRAISYQQNFEKLLSDDMDMPSILSNLWSLLKDNNLQNDEKYKLALIHDSVIGVGMESFTEDELDIDSRLQGLLNSREVARKRKDWEAADRIRDQIHNMGYEILDLPEGVKLRKC